MATRKKNKPTKLESIKSFFEDVAENVLEGASVVGEKIKETSSDVYEAGSEFIDEANDRINAFTDKVSLQKELKKLEKRQEEIASEFGNSALNYYLKNNNLHKAFLSSKSIESLSKEFKSNIKDLLSIEKKLKKLNK